MASQKAIKLHFFPGVQRFTAALVLFWKREPNAVVERHI